MYLWSCSLESALQVQCLDDFLQRQLCVTDNGIGRSVVYPDVIILAYQPAAKDHVSEEALTLVGGLRFENRLACPCDDLPRLGAVQQNRPETIAIISVDPVVNFEPAPVGFERYGTGADLRLIPMARAGSHQAAVVSPAVQVGRFGYPDILFVEEGGDGPVQGVKLALDFPGKKHDILIFRTEDDAVTTVRIKILRRYQAGCHADRGNRDVIDIVYTADQADPRILEAECFVIVCREDRGDIVNLEIDAVFAAGQSQMRNRSQVSLSWRYY